MMSDGILILSFSYSCKVKKLETSLFWKEAKTVTLIKFLFNAVSLLLPTSSSSNRFLDILQALIRVQSLRRHLKYFWACASSSALSLSTTFRTNNKILRILLFVYEEKNQCSKQYMTENFKQKLFVFT